MFLKFSVLRMTALPLHGRKTINKEQMPTTEWRQATRKATVIRTQATSVLTTACAR